MSTSLQLPPVSDLIPAQWRDPHTVPVEQRKACIQHLENACADHPGSADLRTVLGMAYAVNYDVYKSLDALERATLLDPEHFFAQLKLAELWFRLRALPRAERETLKALQLASNTFEIQLARKQLQEIRKLNNNSVARPSWGRSLKPGVALLALLSTLSMAVLLWR